MRITTPTHNHTIFKHLNKSKTKASQTF